MSTTTSTTDFAHSIPSLEEDGSNWYMFLQKFEAAVDNKGVWGHFDGTAKRPAEATPAGAVEEAKSPKPGAAHGVVMKTCQ